MVSARREHLQEDAQFQVMRLIERDPQCSQRRLADELGLSLGATHYVLRGLIDHGLVKLGRFRDAPDKRRYAYVLTPGGLAAKAAITQRFLARRRTEYEALRREFEELGAEFERASGNCGN